ncbi:MAG: histidine phosphatase family protein [Candidatus Humimicrobiaceae bacterium]
MDNNRKFIFLIRHGQTEFNDKSIFRGHLDIPLNSYGINQAESIGKILKFINFDMIYSSPLKRAKKTAEIINKFQNKNVDILAEKGFIDINYGKWEGKTYKEVSELYPEIYFQWLKNPYNAQIPGGESLYDTQKRSWDALVDIINNNKNKIICIISHRVINKLLLSKMLGIAKNCFLKIRQDTGCINLIEHNNKKFIVLNLNYNSDIIDFKNSIKTMDF